jgi:2,3-dihydroxy-p-cumate/2,3-dihydroxybenzoate 3,4-dioxygenase
MKLRSVEIEVPDPRAAVSFLKDIWGLRDAGSGNGTSYLRGSEPVAYVVSLTEARDPALASITFSGDRSELERIRARASGLGVRVGATKRFEEPGNGEGFALEGPEGQVFRFVSEHERVGKLPLDRNTPMQVTHVVLNTPDREACTSFLVDVLGFRLSDRSRFMNFVRCDEVHHAIAYAQSELSSLNHIAFEMTDLDAVMCGLGRLRDAGYESAWGPGRHGPGNNVFAYFVTPFGVTVEYTAEVQRVGDDYRVGGPEDWKWPPGRSDHWGVARRDNAALAQAEKRFRFRKANF